MRYGRLAGYRVQGTGYLPSCCGPLGALRYIAPHSVPCQSCSPLGSARVSAGALHAALRRARAPRRSDGCCHGRAGRSAARARRARRAQAAAAGGGARGLTPGSAAQISHSPIYSHFQESLAGIDTVRAYGYERRFAADSDRHVDYNHRRAPRGPPAPCGGCMRGRARSQILLRTRRFWCFARPRCISGCISVPAGSQAGAADHGAAGPCPRPCPRNRKP